MNIKHDEQARPNSPLVLALALAGQGFGCMSIYYDDHLVDRRCWRWDPTAEIVSMSYARNAISELKAQHDINSIALLKKCESLGSGDSLPNLHICQKLLKVLSDEFPNNAIALKDVRAVPNLMNRFKLESRSVIAVRRDGDVATATALTKDATSNPPEQSIALATEYIGTETTSELPILHAFMKRISDERICLSSDGLRSKLNEPSELEPYAFKQFCIAVSDALAVELLVSKLLKVSQSKRRIVLEGGQWSENMPALLAMYLANDEILVTPKHHTRDYALALAKWPVLPELSPAKIQAASYVKHAWRVRLHQSDN